MGIMQGILEEPSKVGRSVSSEVGKAHKNSEQDSVVGSTRMKDSGRKRLRCGYEDARRFHIPCFYITSHLGDPYAVTGIYRLHGHLHLGEIWAFFKALDKSKDSMRGPGQHEPHTKLLLRRYRHVPRTGTAEWEHSTAFVLSFVADGYTSRRRIYWLTRTFPIRWERIRRFP
ncbi:hypothetical protein Naga_100006g83 [Nannochloropsis gaditana]|uniref:Uncharacterized protein n=1 Tax=Nannochloropsis gaditana TaxID=72520 RepID=W7TTR0_9STRA|nr:hypothetical protein Naga_100006g83 [Nannochloropsis gaditana]